MDRSLQISQFGQDYWVFGEVFNEKTNGFFLDIGAYNGYSISNTYILEKRYGWNGFCIEANPLNFEILKQNRRVQCYNLVLDSSERIVKFSLSGPNSGITSDNILNDNHYATESEIIEVKTKRLDSFLVENNAPHIIDYLSIDIEGAEERVLESFPFDKYIFNSITIERPTELIMSLLEINGYLLIKRIPKLDCFYIHKSFVDQYLKNMTKFYNKKRLFYRWN